jgi:hypothetical protein
MTAHLFYPGIVCRGHNPLTWKCAKNAMNASHRLLGTLRILKDLYLFSWHSSVSFGSLRRMPRIPKDAKFCVRIFWHSWHCEG